MADPEIPKDWEGVLNAPLRWIRRRVPARFRGCVLFVLVLLIALPIAWKAWESIVGLLVMPRELSFLVLPHHDVPYGQAYFRRGGETIESTRSYPIYNIDMHETPVVQPLTEMKDVIRDGYRITIGNPTDRKFLVTGVTMHVRRYEKLPARYVCAWNRKGLQEVLTADFDLRPGTREATLLDEKRVIELPAGEAQVILARVRDADPGLYTFYFSAHVQSIRGKVSTFNSGDFRLLVPNRDARRPDPRGVSIALSGDAPTLVRRLLDIDAPGWQKLRDASNPRSLDAGLALSRGLNVGQREDAAFVQDLLRRAALPPPGAMRPVVNIISDCVEGRDDAADCARTLLQFKQRDQAMRVLRDGLARHPSDANAAAKLIALLLEDKRPAHAREVWNGIYERAGPHAGLYDAGFALARATADRGLAERLARDSAMQFPDSVELLVERARFHRISGHADEALRALAGGCRAYDQHTDRWSRRLLRRLVREEIILMSNRGNPEVRTWLPELLRRCPAQIAWDLRTSPALWHYPSMPRPMARTPTSPRESLERIRACIASGRGGIADRELGFLERTGKTPDRAEGRELLGDIWIGLDKYESAGDAYLRAYRLGGLPKVRMEGIAVKAAFAYYRAKSKKVLEVFEAAGPRLMRASDLPPDVPPLPGMPKDQMVLYDPHWEAEQARGLVWMVRGFATGSYEIASSGFVATLTADPVFALGQTTADGDSYDALSPVVETIRRWGQSRDTVPVLPASFIEYFMERYLREERIFEPDESAPDEDYAGRFERGDRMVQVMEHVKVERASAYFVRVRGGMTFGTLLPPKDEVFTGTSWMSFAQWQARERPRHRDAREGVYLEKLTGPRLEAERAFRRGVERAYRHYEVKQGLIEIEGSLLKDPWNVEALRIAAQLNAVAGLPRRCVEFAELGLELDPIAFGLATLAKDCRTAPTR